MSESSSPSKVCFNPQCGASAAEKWRKGWTLRSGEIVELCDRCGSAYEEQRFCEDFHFDVSGWRNCETCGKRLHCGCIASVHKYYLLDAGGVECVVCANKNLPGVSLFRPPSWFPSLSHLDGLTDQAPKVWGQIPVTGSDIRQQQQLPLVWHYMSQHSESYPGMRHLDAGKPSDRFPGKVCPVTCSMEKKNVGDSHEKDSDNSSNTRRFHIYDSLGNRISDVDYKNSLGASIQEAYIDGLRDPSYIAGRKSNEGGKNISAEELGRRKSVNISKCEPQESYLNIEQLPSLLKDDISNVSGPSLPFSRESNLKHPNDAQQQRYLQSAPKQHFSTCHAGLGSSVEKQSQVSATRPYTDGKVKNQSMNRYCPRITVQELQKISGNSNCVVTPLFEKMLSASDAGRVGRLVLPKKCAEAYFPAISHPEGLPLRIQDANGKEWVFQFRFWPNNNSRMYVLEGVTSCIQSMQLQAGDIVTFSRIDPEGKLVMGFRKTSNTASHQNELSLENQNGEVPNRIGGCNEVVTALPAYSAKGAFDSTRDSSCDQIGPVSVVSYLDKTSKTKASSGSAAFSLDKRKKRTCGSKRKRLSVDNANSAKIKPTWEEAQKLLQPPPNHSPTIVVIEGHEFEEYEEPPVFGNRPIFAAKQLGSSRSSAREISSEQLQSGPAKSGKEGRAAKRTKSGKCLSKLDTLADLAILDEKEQEQHPSAHSTTTKHPRHRPGCSCIVCIQPPSGQGPKHEPNCMCNVCLMVKRRFQTLMLRRKKLQSEKETENDEENHQCSPEKSEGEKIEASDGKVFEFESERRGDKPINKSSDSSRNSGNNELPLSCSPYNKEESGSIGKGQIDLNCQPEREEDFFPNSDLDGSSKPLNEYVWMDTSCPADHEKQIEAHPADPVDGQSKDEANDGQKLDWQGADAGVSGITNLSTPGPIPATTVA